MFENHFVFFENLQFSVTKKLSGGSTFSKFSFHITNILFIQKRKIVNCAFGSNVPKLMSMIAAELDIERKCRDGQAERVYYELTEMCSVELERFNAKKALEEVRIM